MNLEALKKAKFSLYLVALIELAIGVVFIIYPKFSLHIISAAVGLSFLVQGALKLYHFFRSGDKASLLPRVDALFGIMLLVLGILLFISRFQLDQFIGIVLAVILLINGLSKLKIAFELKRLGFAYWWMTAAFALLTIVIAVALLFNLSAGGIAVAIFIGVSLLFDALLNFSAAYSARRVN